MCAAIERNNCEEVSAAILREQSAIENCEETVSVVSVCESKEKLGRFFFSRETTQKEFGVSFRELLSVNS